MEQKTPKSTRLRFTYEDDLALLREFIANNPLEDPKRWEIIKQHLEEITGKMFLVKTIKKHLQLLLELFLKKEDTDKKKSGIEEVYSEKNHLLQEVSDMCRDTNFLTPKPKVSKEAQIAMLGRQARDKMAMATMGKELDDEGLITVNNDHNYVEHTEIDIIEVELDSKKPVVTNLQESIMDYQENNEVTSKTEAKRTTLVPGRKRVSKSKPLRQNTLSYLREKQDKDNDIKLKEINLQGRKLHLEERKIIIEEKKLEMELAEKKQRLEIEKERFELEKQKLDLDVQERRTLNLTIKNLLQRLSKYES